MAKVKEESKKMCAVCDKPATLKCLVCYQRCYCGPDHQSKDWAKHKPQCERLMKGLGSDGKQNQGRSFQQDRKEYNQTFQGKMVAKFGNGSGVYC